MLVRVKARAPLARRCRCGYCFDAEGQEIHVSARELAALKADPLLVVTECEAPQPSGAPGESDDAPPQDGAPEGDPNA